MSAIDKNTLPTAVIMDLSKAFDTLKHNILLAKLYHCGMRGTFPCGFECYLSNTNLYVEIGGIVSHTRVITKGGTTRIDSTYVFYLYE